MLRYFITTDCLTAKLVDYFEQILGLKDINYYDLTINSSEITKNSEKSHMSL